jgi:N-acetyl-anhydromuramyl-L-alanine amidase AmpD
VFDSSRAGAYGRRGSPARRSLAFFLLWSSACRSASVVSAPPPELRDSTAGEEIRVCGRRFYVGVPVVLWSEEPHYDGSSEAPRFGVETAASPKGRRYQPGRKVSGAEGRTLVEPGSEDLDRLRDVVDQFVLHYDAAGTSQRCFQVLQDERGLSVHFLLDVDGTIYQTLDLRDQAWHATKANPRSIGIEIANLGAVPPGQAPAADSKTKRIRGVVQGIELEQPEFTPQQYDALAKLAAALCTIFPKIAPDAPRDPSGVVRTTALSDAEFADFHGILGHLHVQTNKQDPGPAFDWENFLAAVRGNLARSEVAP